MWGRKVIASGGIYQDKHNNFYYIKINKTEYQIQRRNNVEVAICYFYILYGYYFFLILQ